MVGLKAVYYIIDKRAGEQAPRFTLIITVRIVGEQEPSFFFFFFPCFRVYLNLDELTYGP